VLALPLAISGRFGKGAQTHAISSSVEAANLRSFFQAETIRQTTLRTAVEEATFRLPATDGAALRALNRQVEASNVTVARRESEPATGGGPPGAHGPGAPCRSRA